ncbi:MAG TPA: FRG domain-containing protein [bacterium]|nr:FRG domain-containing protein [bacterium]
MTAVYQTYAEVIAQLSKLPPVNEGFARVFRGQTNDYGSMKPTGLRGNKTEDDVIWRLYSHLMANDIISTNVFHNDNHADYFQDPSYFFFWLYLIKQHYGPGTGLLDVTHSVDIALWFALHKATKITATAVMGEPGPFDADKDILVKHHVIKFEPWTEKPGHLYVLDVPKLNAGNHLQHGTLFDIKDAPDIFSTCTRITNQHASLIWADKSTAGGDLKSFFACDPIQVRWPLHGAREIMSPVEALFPPPSKDIWYKKFISSPPILKAGPADDDCYFELPIKIYQYLSDDKNNIIDHYKCHTAIRPPLLYIDLFNKSSTRPHKYKLSWLFRLLAKNATPVLLEGPMYSGTPSVKSKMWNEGLLAGDWDDNARVLDLGSGNISGSVSLSNVFLEFSPLEASGWERIEEDKQGIELLRGVWLRRFKGLFILAVFYQQFPSGRISAFGPLFVVYDKIEKELIYTQNKLYFRNFEDDDLLKKPLFLALTLVRDLSSSWKVSPYPLMLFDKQKAMLRVSRAVCCLVNHPKSFGYHFIRKIKKLEEPYCGPGSLDEKSAPSIFLDINDTFSNVDAQEIRKSIMLEVQKRNLDII